MQLRTSAVRSTSKVNGDRETKSQEVPYYAIVEEALKDVVVNLYLNQGAAYKAIIQELQNALTGQKSAQQAMDDAQEKVDSILK